MFIVNKHYLEKKRWKDKEKEISRPKKGKFNKKTETEEFNWNPFQGFEIRCVYVVACTHIVFDSVIIWISCRFNGFILTSLTCIDWIYKEKKTKRMEKKFVRERLNLIATKNLWVKNRVASAGSFSIDCFFSFHLHLLSQFVTQSNHYIWKRHLFWIFRCGKVCQNKE